MENKRKISPSAIYNFVAECEANEKINLINFALVQSNDILAWFCKKPYKKNAKQLLFSMTKSFTSLAIGIASDNGILCLDDNVVSFFPEDLPRKPHSNLLKMQIRHLLTMTTGIHDNTYSELFPQSNWVKAFLAQDFPHEPGTYYRYSTHATHMLSAIIQKVSGTSLENFLNDHLFSVMGIIQAQWELSPEGLTAGGMGLSLRPSALIKVARMLLNKGMYKDKRIISEKYITLATSPQVIKQDDITGPDKYFSGYRYGFQFHISPGNAYRADGAFGQFCIVYPEKNLAIIATSQKTETESFLALIDKYFVCNGMHMDTISKAQLDIYLSKLSFPVPNQSKKIYNPPQCLYQLEDNELSIKNIRFIKNKLQITFSNHRQDNIDIDFRNPVYGKSHFIKDLQVHLQEHCVLARWENESTLILMIYYIETPYIGEYRLQFSNDNDKVIFTFNINVSMTLKGFTVIGIKQPNKVSEHNAY